MTNASDREYSDNLDRTPIDQNNPTRVTRYALIPATVAVIRDGRPIPSTASSVKAMIDTGASDSAVSRALACDMKLAEAGTDTGMGMEGAAVERQLYRAHLELKSPRIAWDAAFFETAAGQGLFDIIIGNDLLANLTFFVDGPAGRFTLRHPT